MNPLAGSNGDTDREQTCGHSREGEGGVNGDSMETNIIICKIDSQWEVALWLRELKPVLCANLEGWDGVGGRFKKKGTRCTYGWFMVMCGRNQHNIVKQLSFN